MQRFIIIIFILTLLKISSFAQSTPAFIEVDKTTYQEIENIIKGVKKEKILVETNQYGQILHVDSRQPAVVAVLNGKFIAPTIENNNIVATKTRIKIKKGKTANIKILDVQKDSIRGRLMTAIRLSEYMKLKQYSEAKELFSKRQQDNINKMEKEHKELYSIWRQTWTLKKHALDYYLGNIMMQNHSNSFVFEDGMWKIDER